LNKLCFPCLVEELPHKGERLRNPGVSAQVIIPLDYPVRLLRVPLFFWSETLARVERYNVKLRIDVMWSSSCALFAIKMPFLVALRRMGRV
jgi:hypothetical protein